MYDKLVTRALGLMLCLTLGVLQSVVVAGPITAINIPVIGVTYKGPSDPTDPSQLTISGTSDVTVEYSSQPTAPFDDAFFSLNTDGMDSLISGLGETIAYTPTLTSNGSISLLNDSFSPLLLADLVSLDMSISNSPVAGVLSGVGSFIVQGGSLADEFGPVGAVSTFGILFQTPVASFNNPFGGLASVTLTPTGGQPTAIPEIASIGIWGIVILMGIGGGIWTSRRVS